MSVVWLFNPVDVRAMYKAEGSQPSRRSHTALAHLRASKPESYNTGGLLPTNGAEWQRIRAPLQKPLLGTLAASRFLPGLDALMREVVEWVGEHREALMERDMLPELEKIFMETTGLLVLERRLSALKLDLPSDSIPSKLINAARDVNSSVLATDNGLPVWKLWETKDFRRTKEGMEMIARVASDRVRERVEQLDSGEEWEEGSLLDQCLRRGYLHLVPF